MVPRRYRVSPAVATVALVDDAKRFLVVRAAVGWVALLGSASLTAVRAARGARRGSDTLFVVVTSSWEISGAFSGCRRFSSASVLGCCGQGCSWARGKKRSIASASLAYRSKRALHSPAHHRASPARAKKQQHSRAAAAIREALHSTTWARRPAASKL